MATKNNKLFTKAKKIFFMLKQIEQEFVKGEFNNFDYYLENSYNINHVDYALEWSAYHGRLDLVKKAIEKGGDPNNSNSAPIQMASRNGHLDIVKYLMEKGTDKAMSNINILVEAIEKNHDNIVNYLLGDNDYGRIILCNINIDHDYALRTAIKLERTGMVKKLINSGANVNVLDGLCLNIAIEQENINIVQQLLDANIDTAFVKKILDSPIWTKKILQHNLFGEEQDNYDAKNEIRNLLNMYLLKK